MNKIEADEACVFFEKKTSRDRQEDACFNNLNYKKTKLQDKI